MNHLSTAASAGLFQFGGSSTTLDPSRRAGQLASRTPAALHAGVANETPVSRPPANIAVHPEKAPFHQLFRYALPLTAFRYSDVGRCNAGQFQRLTEAFHSGQRHGGVCNAVRPGFRV